MTKVIQVVGYKNTGKTTMMEWFVNYFIQKGYRVGTIKHDGHEFEMDHEDTDTWRHTKAGAHVTAISSRQKSAIVKQQPMSLEEMIQQMDQDVDLIFVEGFKKADFPKIVMLKERQELSFLQSLTNVVACITWFSDCLWEGETFSIEEKQKVCYFLNKNVIQKGGH
ncbi:molybdopterin-guanine dinucleotide biosynthesis protein B [Virgibacillus sp. MSP4-1]|uniref:molybdopterin-guanine dinucleotide biosynthesis protein B n=1 Tax=Virgibacillus sp. MSP4-1 TaxID=2700081 RepID=UPI0003A5C288|nr:molybdopterin-guanine dinucleotide biosynthesis protein B [Virgibacillus sp. MSP4-1]QHS21965.1 molybdopterin-guanine dinucleotide biosynthesis protein B [Virgibacillus sp. MSP4-1]